MCFFTSKYISPLNPLKSEIDSMRDGEEILLLTNGERNFNFNEINPGNKIGTKDLVCITNLSRDERVDQLELKLSNLSSKVSIMETKLDWLMDSTATPTVQNCAAQILLFFLGVQPLNPTLISSLFINIEKQSPDRYAALINMEKNLDIDLSSRYIIASGDQVINRRNINLHPEKDIDLDTLVKRCNEIFRIYPDLINRCQQEYNIIRNYNGFKTNFPSKP